MFDQQIADLIRENERMKTALKAIQSYAETAAFGVWRQHVVNIAREGLSKPQR